MICIHLECIPQAVKVYVIDKEAPLDCFGLLLQLGVPAFCVRECSRTIFDWSPSLSPRITLLHGGCHSTWHGIRLQPCLALWVKVCLHCVLCEHCFNLLTLCSPLKRNVILHQISQRGRDLGEFFYKICISSREEQEETDFHS